MARIIVNNTELTGEVFGGKQLIQNAQRDTLTLKIEATGSFDTLLSQLADTSEITIVETKTVHEYDDETGEDTTKEVTETSIYNDYTIIFKRSIESELVTPETPDSPAVYKDVYVIGLAQKTYLEKQIELLQQLLK
jgi:hypothetical protein